MENEAMNIMETMAETAVEDNTMAAPICAQADAVEVGKFPIKPLIIGGIIIGGIILYNKDKIENWFTKKRIKALEKKGYTVVKVEDDIDAGYDHDDDCEDDIGD